MRWPSVRWKVDLRDRAVWRRLLKYAAIALGLHIALTILQLPAALKVVHNAGQELCILVRENELSAFTGGRMFFGLVDWPRSLERELKRLAPTLARSCNARAYPVGDLRSLLLGDMELEIGSDNPAEGIVIEIRQHLFWQGIAELFGFIEQEELIAMAVTGHRRWRWPEAGGETEPRPSNVPSKK